LDKWSHVWLFDPVLWPENGWGWPLFCTLKICVSVSIICTRHTHLSNDFIIYMLFTTQTHSVCLPNFGHSTKFLGRFFMFYTHTTFATVITQNIITPFAAVWNVVLFCCTLVKSFNRKLVNGCITPLANWIPSISCQLQSCTRKRYHKTNVSEFHMLKCDVTCGNREHQYVQRIQ